MSAKRQVQMSGMIAGETQIATVGSEGEGLTYRGYDIEDLAVHSSYEEVAFLLLRGHLPNRKEMEEFSRSLRDRRTLPEKLRSSTHSPEPRPNRPPPRPARPLSRLPR